LRRGERHGTGLPDQFRDVLRRVFGEGMSHPFLQPGYHHAAAESVNEKTVPDALGDGVSAFWDLGFGDHSPHLFVQSLFGQRPHPFPGLQTGPLMADAMHLIEEIKEGINYLSTFAAFMRMLRERISDLFAWFCPYRGKPDFPTEAHFIRLFTAPRASGRPLQTFIAVTDKPSTRRPYGGAVKEILNQSPVDTRE
jgi:hypothetical protein